MIIWIQYYNLRSEVETLHCLDMNLIDFPNLDRELTLKRVFHEQ
jgi:hypothetical protein